MEGIDHRKATSLAGLYLHTLEAIFRTSSSASGGSHRLLFVTSNAASISSAPIPRRRIVPQAIWTPNRSPDSRSMAAGNSERDWTKWTFRVGVIQHLVDSPQSSGASWSAHSFVAPKQ